jgi:hypothetical protein
MKSVEKNTISQSVLYHHIFEVKESIEAIAIPKYHHLFPISDFQCGKHGKALYLRMHV